MSFISLHTIPAKNLSSFAKHTTILLLSYTHYLTLHILKINIYLAAYISKHFFLHFSYTISYTLTTPLHITHHDFSKLHSHALSHWNSTVLLLINISQYSSTPILLPLENQFLQLLQQLYSHIFTIFNHHISHTSIYHTYYKYYIPQNIYV